MYVVFHQFDSHQTANSNLAIKIAGKITPWNTLNVEQHTYIHVGVLSHHDWCLINNNEAEPLNDPYERMDSLVFLKGGYKTM